jgi:dimethylhistidine N-methyltransferase
MNYQVVVARSAREIAAATRSLPPSPQEVRNRPSVDERFRRDVVSGLSRVHPAIPSVWFYDAKGSRLFQRIMDLPCYYPTRVETSILQRSATAIVGSLGQGPSAVVDLGAGDGSKTRLVLSAARARNPVVAYSPVDVSRAALRAASARMRATWPGLEIRAVHADYVEGLRRAAAESFRGPLLALLLGSNIGNLEWGEALDLLRALRASLRAGDHLLVGFDMMKDVAVLKNAYDDPDGLTAAFNVNLLARINRQLDGDFDVDAFEHRATFDPGRPAMESWLVARRGQTAHVSGHRFTFHPGDAIHTEISWKYTAGQITELARDSGFDEVECYHDDLHWFADALWRAGPERTR